VCEIVGGECNGHDPKIRKNEVESQQVTWVGADKKRKKEEYDCKHGNNFLIDDVTALVVVDRDEIRKDSHHNNGRDPDQHIAGKEERREPVSSSSSQFHNFEVELSGMWER